MNTETKESAVREAKKKKHAISIKPLSDEIKASIISDLLGESRYVETKPGEYHEVKIDVGDLKINVEHLRQISEKYGKAYAYDIHKLASLNPRLLMELTLKGHEDDFNYNQIAQEFLANKASINTDKALQFFAEAPVPLDTVYLIRNRLEMRDAEQLARAGIKGRGAVDGGRFNRRVDSRVTARAATPQPTRTASAPQQATPTRTDVVRD